MLQTWSLQIFTWNPKQKWMFGETTISYVKIGNHPIETTIYKWLFAVPGICKLEFFFLHKIPLANLEPEIVVVCFCSN